MFNPQKIFTFEQKVIPLDIRYPPLGKSVCYLLHFKSKHTGIDTTLNYVVLFCFTKCDRWWNPDNAWNLIHSVKDFFPWNTKSFIYFSSIFHRKFFIDASSVDDAETNFGIDQYSDVTMVAKPVVYMTVQEILDTHQV